MLGSECHPLDVTCTERQIAADIVRKSRPWKMNLMASSSATATQPARLYLAVNRYINVMDVQSLRPLSVLRNGKDEPATGDQTDDINYICTGMIGTEEVLVSVDDEGTVLVRYTRDLDIPPLVFRLLAMSANSWKITVWHLAADDPSSPHGDFPLGRRVRQRSLEGHTHNIPAIAFTNCGEQLCSTSIDGTCRLWNLRDGTCVYTHKLGVEWGWHVSTLTADFVTHVSFNYAQTVSEKLRAPSLQMLPGSFPLFDDDDEVDYHDDEASHASYETLKSDDSEPKKSQQWTEFVMCTDKTRVYLLARSEDRLEVLSKYDLTSLATRSRSPLRYFERANIAVKLDKIGAFFVASQDGRGILARMIRVCHDDPGEDTFHIAVEQALPDPHLRPMHPLLGATAVCLQEGSCVTYRLLLLYYDAVVLCYDIRRQEDFLHIELVL
ncbi:hypothetical protein RI367_002138 [Sorochytrium milnesiophthora]